MMVSSRTRASHPLRHRLGTFSGLLLVLALAVTTGTACSTPKVAPSSKLFLDEAFVTLYPELAEKLVPREADFSGFALTDLESARQKAIQQSATGSIIASPLVAAGANGAIGRIISPFLPSPLASASGVKTILYDYDFAYERMGFRAGRVTARKGSSALCALVFQPNAMRGWEALEAFMKAPTGVKTEGFRSLSAMVRECSGPAGAEWYKPFTGSLTSQVEVGIATRQMWDRRHEHGYGRAELLNYEIVGGKAIEVALGKKSGRAAVAAKLAEFGLDASWRDLETLVQTVRAEGERLGRPLTDEEARVLLS